jgi:hypothetical protein
MRNKPTAPAAPAAPQQAPAAAPAVATELEEVVVRGRVRPNNFDRSQKKPLAVDSIAAEDVGKFPIKCQ